MESLTLRQARRLALTKAGLLKPQWVDLPSRAKGKGKRARNAALRILEHFGYLQLDTVSIAGARSHALVLLSRLEGMNPSLGEQLLQPGEPVFEYWGHEASWMPLSLYPAFEFRRKAFRHHPWWGDLIGEHPKVATQLRQRIRDEGPLRSVDMEGEGSRGWWDLKLTKRVATALWSCGELAIRERRHFQRSYDLVERVIPADSLSRPLSRAHGFESLLMKALDGHGWATTGTLAATWRLRNCRQDLSGALSRLREQGKIVPCGLENPQGKPTLGWIQTADLDLAARLDSIRPRRDHGVLLSPFDPVLWDRKRVERLFGFRQILEIFKPAPQREFGYFCLPVLAGETLIARFDLKADRRQGRLQVLSAHFEDGGIEKPTNPRNEEACVYALNRLQEALQLRVHGWSPFSESR